MNQPRIMLTVEEAAESIGVGRTTMFALIKSGDVQSVLIGRLRRVSQTALDDYLTRLAAEQSGAGQRAEGD